MKVSVKDFVDASDNPEQFDWYYYDESRDQYEKVKFYQDATGLDERFYLFGREYGAEMIVSCYDGDGTAHGIWLDELTPIEYEEVHEAYNAFDKLLEYMEAKGYENDQQLRGFCNRWCKFYFNVDTKEDGAWDRWELDEAYQYQPNATDTGIVYAGHYEWMREIDPSEVYFERKGVE